MEYPRAPSWGNIAESEPAPPPQTNAPPVIVPAIPPPAEPTPAAPTNHHVETWVALDRWCQERGDASLRRISGGPAPAFALTTGGGVLVFHPGSLVAAWNGVELHLGFAPELSHNEPFLH